jgi:BolA family transcriptional regulator, general stress-responsive regulator
MLNSEQRLKLIRERLEKHLSPSVLEIIDESSKHIGHSGAQSGAGHFAVAVASPTFEGKSLVEAHRMIYDALGDAMQTEIHALKIKVL